MAKKDAVMSAMDTTYWFLAMLIIALVVSTLMVKFTTPKSEAEDMVRALAEAQGWVLRKERERVIPGGWTARESRKDCPPGCTCVARSDGEVVEMACTGFSH